MRNAITLKLWRKVIDRRVGTVKGLRILAIHFQVQDPAVALAIQVSLIILHKQTFTH